MPLYQGVWAPVGNRHEESWGICENSVYCDISTISKTSIFTNLGGRMGHGLEGCFALVSCWRRVTRKKTFVCYTMG